MPDRAVQQHLTEHEPTAEFVTRTRNQLRAAWNDEPDHQPGHNRRRTLLAAASASLVAATIAVLVVVTTNRTDTNTATQPADNTPPAAAPVTADDVTIADVADHDWVQTTDANTAGNITAARLTFYAANGTVTGSNDCGQWTAPATLDNSRLDIGTLEQPEGGCAAPQPAQLVDAAIAVADDQGTLSLTVTPIDGTPAILYVAADTLQPATGTDLEGTWQTPGGEQITLHPDSSAQVGTCDTVGQWQVGDDGKITISGLDTRPEPCATGNLPGPLTGALTYGPITFDTRVDGAAILLTDSHGVGNWITPS
jgi:heat shock protein HslJ